MDLINHSEKVNKSEQIKQLNREKESMLLEIDIIKQLKVPLFLNILSPATLEIALSIRLLVPHTNSSINLIHQSTFIINCSTFRDF